MPNKPILAIISDDIRRDLHAPMRNFNKLKIIHFYRQARYQDMKKEEFSGTIHYQNHQDLYKKLILAKPDIIQGPEPYASKSALKNCWTVYNYSKKYKIPYFFPMFENRPAEIKFGPILGFVMKKILKKYADGAQAVINLNNGAKSELDKIGIPNKKIIHLNWGTWGVTGEFRPDAKIKQRSKIPLIVFVGKIDYQKGILDLLEAFKILVKKIPQAKLQIIGYKSKINDILNIKGVEYLGVIKNQNLPKYLINAWVVATPSITTKIWEEQVGMVNIQAMACGTPVVSTTSGAIPEYVPDKIAGLLVPEKNPQKLAQALIKILTNKKLRDKLGKGAHQFAMKNYLDTHNIKLGQDFVLRILNEQK